MAREKFQLKIIQKWKNDTEDKMRKDSLICFVSSKICPSFKWDKLCHWYEEIFSEVGAKGKLEHLKTGIL